MSEIMTGVVPSQVIAPARAFARAFPHIPVRVVFLEAARVAIAPRTRRRLREIRKLWPEGRIDVSAYVGRMGEFAPSMALRRAVRGERTRRTPVLFHCRGPEATLQAAQVARQCDGARVIFDMRGACGQEWALRAAARGDDEQTVRAHLERGSALDLEAVRAADAVVAVQQRLIDDVALAGGRNGRTVAVVPCCVDVDRFAVGDGARAGFGNELRLVHMSTEPQWEAFEDVVRLLRSVRALRPARLTFLTTLDPTVVLASVDAADPLRKWIDVRSAAPDEVPAALATAHAGLLLRRSHAVHEYASPIKFAEYLAAGLAVVVSPNIGATRDVVERENLGVTVEPGGGRDAFDGAAASLVALLEQDGDALRCRARAVARDRYSWPNYVDELARVYGLGNSVD